MARNTITVLSEIEVDTCSGGPIWRVTYQEEVAEEGGQAPTTPVQVGDWVTVYKMEEGTGVYGAGTLESTYTYQVTAIESYNTLDLTYITDTNEDGTDSPCDLPAGDGTSGDPSIAPHTFYRDLGVAFEMFME
jgi:hypothetical protein